MLMMKKELSGSSRRKRPLAAEKGNLCMNRDDLELFTAILEEKNLAKAAERLYLSTSTAGARLRAMETELGFELFERKKGARTALPTEKGQAFAPIAWQMLSLWNDCDHLSHASDSPSLAIATVDSFLDYNLTPLYRSLIYEHGFSLDIKCYPADMIYSLVSKKQADIGFALYHADAPSLNITPILSDEMVLVTPKREPKLQDTPAPVSLSPSALNPEKELLVGSRYNSNIGWGPEFMLWHDRHIGASTRPLLTASSISILTGFLDTGDYWSIMPLTTARGLLNLYPVQICRLDPAPPRRTLYLLTHKNPSQISEANIEKFLKHLHPYLRQWGL